MQIIVIIFPTANTCQDKLWLSFLSSSFLLPGNVMKSDPEGCGGKEYIMGIQTEKCIVAFEF
jgi:hypothetical protein